jgi:hypothetical protein
MIGPWTYRADCEPQHPAFRHDFHRFSSIENGPSLATVAMLTRQS